jgi:hypothetical protein
MLGQAKDMRIIKCQKFSELNTALNIWAEQSVRTSLDQKRCNSLSFTRIKKCLKIR